MKSDKNYYRLLNLKEMSAAIPTWTLSMNHLDIVYIIFCLLMDSNFQGLNDFNNVTLACDDVLIKL